METVKGKCIENCYDCKIQGVNKTACGVARLVGKVSCMNDNVNVISALVNNQNELISAQKELIIYLSEKINEALLKIDTLLATPENPDEDKKNTKTK